MPRLIEFVSRDDRIRAIDVLLRGGETYGGVPPSRFIVSDNALRLLGAENIPFRFVERSRREEHGGQKS